MIALDFTEKGKQIRRASLHKKNQKNIIKKNRGEQIGSEGNNKPLGTDEIGKAFTRNKL